MTTTGPPAVQIGLPPPVPILLDEYEIITIVWINFEINIKLLPLDILPPRAANGLIAGGLQ